MQVRLYAWKFVRDSPSPGDLQALFAWKAAIALQLVLLELHPTIKLDKS